MAKSTDTFLWTSKLQCPSTICNESVKNILCSGFIGLLWDDLADVIHSAQEAQTVRKNILLHHLKQGTSNKVIQCKKNVLKLKSETNDLKNEISKLEKEYEQQDFVIRQIVKKQREISSKRSEIRSRRDLLKMKHDETITQLRDCNDMRLVCQHLMPATCKELDPKRLMEMSDTVITLWTGANKKQAWNRISSNLSHIEVPTLWRHIYQNLTEDVDALIMSEIAKPKCSDEKGINIGIARIYGQHICMVSRQLIHKKRANNYQQNVMEFIEKIETASDDADVSEWLALTLEVRKLETEQTSLQVEIEKICGNLYEDETIAVELAQLTSEIEYIDTEIAGYIQDIQQSIGLLKSAPVFLMKTREKIHLELQRILAMRADGYDSTVLNNNLTTELDIFYDVLDLNALRKVMLKGDIGVYRHVKSCFSEASISVPASRVSHVTLYFPFIQTPIYSLIECYKNLILMFAYKRFESLEIEGDTNLVESSKVNFMSSSQMYEENNYNTLELLNSSKVVNTRAKAEINEFNELLNAWVNQTVQKIMEIIEKTVDDATFPQWTERYDLLLYMLQNSR
ncbi:uncharacterized protein LOC108624848 isoform X2 [Ceratina calcarata]|nr:uncharacterized protein LOC108624848 isoform X2 [Ceratina calcarata]XP_026669226.1 uncharacterized protein LOC108624848 isoform X2 [Ceratina calcarata]XP_026669227.1 uncharacterized protein LOC108624848 isoform X2 [Ceratina calcarata]